MQWIRRLSYSLYLWHWPILVMYAEYQGEPQTVYVNCVLFLVALVISVISYHLVESPIRYLRLLVRRASLSLGVGTLLVASSLVFATWAISRDGGI